MSATSSDAASANRTEFVFAFDPNGMCVRLRLEFFGNATADHALRRSAMRLTTNAMTEHACARMDAGTPDRLAFDATTKK
jgi:hypothetical protein